MATLIHLMLLAAAHRWSNDIVMITSLIPRFTSPNYISAANRNGLKSGRVKATIIIFEYVSSYSEDH